MARDGEGGIRLPAGVAEEVGGRSKLDQEIGLAGLLLLLACAFPSGHSEPLSRPHDDLLAHELGEARPAGGGLLFRLLIGRTVCGLAPIPPFLVVGDASDRLYEASSF